MAKNGKSRSGVYEVGRGRPPKDTQFKKGQSGNPSGRKKGSLNMATLVRKVVSTEIPVTENGARRCVPALEGILVRQMHEALRGNARATQLILDLCQQHLPTEEVDATAELKTDDEAILRRALSKSRKDSGGGR